MQLPKNTRIVVTDGTKLHLFRDTGDEAHPKLTALTDPAIGGDNNCAGVHHSSGSAKTNDSRLEPPTKEYRLPYLPFGLCRWRAGQAISRPVSFEWRPCNHVAGIQMRVN